MKNSIIEVQNLKINIKSINDKDYICITDIAKTKGGKSRTDDIIKNWIRNKYTIEFLGTWESLYNPNFKSVEFDGFRKEAGLHTFTISVSEWTLKKSNVYHRAVTFFEYRGVFTIFIFCTPPP